MYIGRKEDKEEERKTVALRKETNKASGERRLRGAVEGARRRCIPHILPLASSNNYRHPRKKKCTRRSDAPFRESTAYPQDH